MKQWQNGADETTHPDALVAWLGRLRGNTPILDAWDGWRAQKASDPRQFIRGLFRRFRSSQSVYLRLSL